MTTFSIPPGMVLNLLCYSCFTIVWSGFQKCGMWMVSRVAAGSNPRVEEINGNLCDFENSQDKNICSRHQRLWVFGSLTVRGLLFSSHNRYTMVIILSVLHPILGMVWPCVHTVYMADSSKRRLSDVVPEACYGWCTKSKEWLKTRCLLAQLLQNLIHQHQLYLVATPKSSRTLFVQWSWNTDRQTDRTIFGCYPRSWSLWISVSRALRCTWRTWETWRVHGWYGNFRTLECSPSTWHRLGASSKQNSNEFCTWGYAPGLYTILDLTWTQRIGLEG